MIFIVNDHGEEREVFYDLCIVPALGVLFEDLVEGELFGEIERDKLPRPWGGNVMERRGDRIEVVDADGNLAPSPSHCPVQGFLERHDREDGLVVEGNVPDDRGGEAGRIAATFKSIVKRIPEGFTV